MSIFQPFSSIPHDHQHRSLYDQAFLDSGCNPTIFEDGGIEETALDNTVGTWSTNYVILVVGLIGAFRVGCMMPPIARRHLWTSGYFLCTGLGYGLAGVNHQIQEVESDPNFYFVAFILTTLGVLSLQYQISANMMAIGKPKSLYLGYTIVVTLIGVGVIAALVVGKVLSLSVLIVAGGHLALSYIWFLIYYGMQKDWANIVGSIIIFVGLALQQGLNPTCGDDGYEVCWEDCPLSSAKVFNHNAVFHVFVFVGMIVQYFGRFVPLQLMEPNEGQQDNNDKAPEEEEEEEKREEGA